MAVPAHFANSEMDDVVRTWPSGSASPDRCPACRNGTMVSGSFPGSMTMVSHVHLAFQRTVSRSRTRRWRPSGWRRHSLACTPSLLQPTQNTGRSAVQHEQGPQEMAFNRRSPSHQ